MTLTCGGCVTSGNAPIERSLPPPPASMQPVQVPRIAKGTSARASLYDHRAALLKANGRLRATGAWYEGVRKEYAEPR